MVEGREEDPIQEGSIDIVEGCTGKGKISEDNVSAAITCMSCDFNLGQGELRLCVALLEEHLQAWGRAEKPFGKFALQKANIV